MRVFDCKSEVCQSVLKDAPRIYDCVCPECKAHFEEMTSYLDEMGIAYQLDKSIVRGLDYYSRTVFEFVSNDIGAQGTVCGGGRYDYLVEELGGKSCPGIGFAMGIERLLMVLENAGISLPDQKEPQLYIAAIGKAVSYTHLITNLDVIFFGIVCFWSAGTRTHGNTSLSELHKLIILIELQKVNRNFEFL